eukprot:TRINITY_DN20642_c0_g1_i1.p2 TRINITY_DN20642_c0_g1~~TRINITY_DN20642_c0_g1_i1.p2  ORF type:complete len:220 (+),score=118.23 TRINITY_DN20642_c0_g1_i1:96-755(+)
MAPKDLNAENPHRAAVRNLRKKLDGIQELKQKPAEELKEEQKKKIQTERKIQKELQEAESKYDQWEVETKGPAAAASPGSAPASAPAPAPAPAPAGSPKKKKEKQKEPQWQAAPEKKKFSPPARPASPDKPASPQAQAKRGDAAAAAPSAASLMDPKEEKSARNRIKNLRQKLEQIASLRQKSMEELDKDQLAKVKSEKKFKEELATLTQKLQAFGLEA